LEVVIIKWGEMAAASGTRVDRRSSSPEYKSKNRRNLALQQQQQQQEQEQQQEKKHGKSQ
jgi:hypothetical protein